jgi:putative ABC transport system permease protein
MRWMDAALTELRFAARALRRAPAFTIAAVLTLALGIGANTAIFSVVYGVLLRPLPYRDADRLIVVQAERNFSGRAQPVATNFSLADYDDCRARMPSLESLAFVSAATATVTDSIGPRSVASETVTDSFFATVGGPIALGRGLTAGDERHVVISDQLWRTQFGSDGDIVGKALTMNGATFTIVGVADASFQIPSADVAVWRLAPRLAAVTLQQRGIGGFLPIGRLRPDATLEKASRDAQSMVEGLMHDYPTRYMNMRARAVTLRDRTVGSVRPALVMLFAAVGLVLLVACANVANLFLVRRTARARETAIRIALGASRRRMIGHAIAEGTVIACAGTVAGLAAAAGIVRAVIALAPPNMPRFDAVRIDAPVLLFAIALTTMAAIVTGLSPSGRGSRRTRDVLIVAELAISVVLLVGATLFGRSLALLLRTDLGAQTDHVATALIDMSTMRSAPPEQLIEKMNRLLERVGALPGVTETAASAGLPPNAARLRFTMNRIDEAVGRPVDYLVDGVVVTPRFFSALRVPLMAGRFFTDADDSQHPPVMIMSASTARDLFGPRDPLGRTLSLPRLDKRPPDRVTLVGVIANVKYAGLDAAPNGAIYLPYAQQPWWSMFLLARTQNDPGPTAAALRQAIAGVDRTFTSMRVATLDEMVAADAAQPRFRTTILIALAAVALALAGVGLYGVIAYSVSRRTTEIGVRVALGAGPRDVLMMILGQGLALSITGIAIGIAASLALVRTIRGLLFGVAATDARSFVVAAFLLLAVSILATFVPARRATRVDPMVALRAE